ncbi:MAG: rod shape-determining protein MreC [Fimbriimonadaceae bacterium]
MIVLIVGSIALGTLQNRLRSAGKLDPVSSLVQIALLPGVASTGAFMESVDLFMSGVGDAKNLREDNIQLRAQLRAAQLYLDTADRNNQEILTLRENLGLSTLGRTRVNADIIHYVPYDNRITLNKGSKDGVSPNLPIVTPDGLLALVSTVSETTCQAVLLTSSAVSIGCLAKSPIPVAGLVKGQRSDRLAMDVFENVTIEPGTEVITTGYSEFIPRGIRIGTVSEYFNDKEYGVRRAFILPSSRIGMSKEVAILK